MELYACQNVDLPDVFAFKNRLKRLNRTYVIYYHELQLLIYDVVFPFIIFFDVISITVVKLCVLFILIINCLSFDIIIPIFVYFWKIRGYLKKF